MQCSRGSESKAGGSLHSPLSTASKLLGSLGLLSTALRGLFGLKNAPKKDVSPLQGSVDIFQEQLLPCWASFPMSA
jgi:hypothetical protein